MVQIDMTRPDRDLTPGVDLWKIIKCEPVQSRAGDPMLKVKFARVSDPQEHIYDNIMLAGGGWGIGKQKLGALLEANFKGDLDPLDLVGKRLWLYTVVDTYKGKDNLKVGIEELRHAGYQRADDPPPGKDAPGPEVVLDEDSAPF